MSEIERILIVPAKGDPHGLLAEGDCGGRPPMAWYCDDSQAWEQWHRGMDHAEPCAWAAMVERARCALVLAWDGKPVPEGLDWLCRRMEWDVFPRGWPDIDAILRWLDGPKPGTLVLLDAEGRTRVLPR